MRNTFRLRQLERAILVANRSENKSHLFPAIRPVSTHYYPSPRRPLSFSTNYSSRILTGTTPSNRVLNRYATTSRSLAFIRHCSYKRNMCKIHGDPDISGSGLDISKSREILPANVKPLHYDLTLEPNFEKSTYEGSVTIE